MVDLLHGLQGITIIVEAVLLPTAYPEGAYLVARADYVVLGKVFVERLMQHCLSASAMCTMNSRFSSDL